MQGTLQTKPAGTRQDGKRNSALIKRGQMWVYAKSFRILEELEYANK